MVIGNVGNIPVAAMQGRVHLYEGYSAQEVAFPIRVFGRMGVRAVILTNAAGGINLKYQQGALVLIKDHINLQGDNPLVGPNDDRFGVRFPDMTHAYTKTYAKAAQEEAAKLGLSLEDGVYAALLGPSYETPAEIRYLRTIGADLVGMSTVAEVIAARHMGIKVLAISCVTNMAAGILDQVLSHQEVMETGEKVRGQFEALLRRSFPRYPQTWLIFRVCIAGAAKEPTLCRYELARRVPRSNRPGTNRSSNPLITIVNTDAASTALYISSPTIWASRDTRTST